MNRLNQTTQQIQQPPPPPSYTDRQFLHTFLAGAFLPLVQSTITAFMSGVAALIFLLLINAIDLLKPSLIVAAVTWVSTWLYLQRRWLNLTAIEHALQLDINGDGRIGQLKPETIVRFDKVKGNGHYQSSKYTFQIEDDQLLDFARGVMQGRPISRRRWAGPDKTFSDGEYRAFQTDLLKFQLIGPGGNGYILTEEGEEFFESYVEQHSPPPAAETLGD